ncbi:MAG: T9SS type A sorting domain-containing protein [Ignavibacteria bacterium]|nr:T9SS type A sorting domain-containing protein [Ignavibacteria bacterium]
MVTDNFKLGFPKFIPESKSFEVSIVTAKGFADADILELEINPSNGIHLNQIELRSTDKTSQIKLKYISAIEPGFKIIKCVIDFSAAQLLDEDFFQVLMTFNSIGVERASVKLKGIFKSDDNVVGYLHNSESSIQTAKENIYKADLSFYEVSSISAQSLGFGFPSSLILPVVQEVKNNLYADFWLKINNPGIEFLSIKNVKTNKIEYGLFTNQFQILSAKSDYHEQSNLMPHFLSAEAWHHISLLFLESEGKAKFYCNGINFSTIALPIVFNPNDYQFEFGSKNNESRFYIEQFRFVNLHESVQNIFKYRSYKNFNLDSSDLLLQMNFDDANSLTAGAENLITYDNIKFSKSDAPMFAEAPELNLVVLNNFYELEWSGGDVNSASYYVIESSEDQGGYNELYRTDAENNEEKKYSYLAEKSINTGVVFYRVKQVNIDGTTVYSSFVKIGQGVMEDIILGQNYPNPFNPATIIEFEILQDAEVEVVVYNLTGKEIDILHHGFLSSGVYKFEFDGSELPSGIYLYKVSTPQFTQTKKMILAK